MKLRVAFVALVAAVVVGVGSSNAARTATLAVTLGESSPYACVSGVSGCAGSGTKLFYSAHTFSFTVTASGGTSPYTFPAVPGFTEVDDGLSATYNGTPTGATAGTYTVTGGGPDSGDFVLASDSTGPTGQTVALSGGPTYSTASVPFVFSKGTDGGADVAPSFDPATDSVERASATLAGGTCGSQGSWAPVTLTSAGTDTTVVSGNCYWYQYKSSDLVGNLSTSWAATAVPAQVSTVGPTVTDTAPTEVSGASDQFWNSVSDTLYFRPAATGSFRLNATASDAASGISKVTFPDVSATAGWSGSTGGDATSSPYVSPTLYTWTAGAAAPGAQKVIATSGSALTAFDTITISADSTAPAGQGVTVTGGPWFGSSVPLALVSGSDSGSGVDATRSVVERAFATLTNGVCGTFATFAAVTLSGNADTSVVSGGCYRYQVKATDNVGNLSVASQPSGDAKVDTTAPTIPTLYFSGFSNTAASGKVVYFRPGGSGSFTVTAASSDPESGVTSYSFPTVSGFTVAGSGPRRTYAFSGSGSAPVGPLSVTATNAAGLSSGTSSFTLVGDGTAPSLTVRCNGGACSKKPYARAVMVTLAAADATSGVGTVRWTSDGTDPRVDHGNQYLRGITVNGVTRLKVRAFDNAGNASPLVSLTVVSRAGRLVFGAPSAVVLGAHARYASVRVTSTRRASVRMTMTGTGLKRPARWSFILDPGTSIVRVRLPKGVKHPGTYRIVWTLRSGAGTTTRSTRLTLRR